ncbi:MAG: GNAT family N-acetyltransferase [Pyrinomonadaceae bacterium]
MSSNDSQTSSVQFPDQNIRFVKESDTEAIKKLFESVYKDRKYPFPDVFDGGWVKKCVYNDDIICLVLEENGEVVGTGALVMDVGNYNDQVGELGRFVVRQDRQGHGRGQSIINGLFQAAENNVEFAVGEAKTAHLKSQKLVEKAGFQALGFLPHYLLTGGAGESEKEKGKNDNENFVIYGKLYGNSHALRSNTWPTLIPEIAPLAMHVLEGMGLNSSLQVVQDAAPYPVETSFPLREVNRLSLAQLGRIKEGRLVEPLLFGKLSLDEGHSFVRRRNAVYLMAVDDVKGPVGAIGFQFDETNKILIGVELIAATENLRGQLCMSLLTIADQFGARIIEVNVSAYDPRLQATFLALGFKPLLYAPAMVFHGTERLDVVKMLRLNECFDSGEMGAIDLTESARVVYSMVESSLKEFTKGGRVLTKLLPPKTKSDFNRRRLRSVG